MEDSDCFHSCDQQNRVGSRKPRPSSFKVVPRSSPEKKKINLWTFILTVFILISLFIVTTIELPFNYKIWFYRHPWVQVLGVFFLVFSVVLAFTEQWIEALSLSVIFSVAIALILRVSKQGELERFDEALLERELVHLYAKGKVVLKEDLCQHCADNCSEAYCGPKKVSPARTRTEVIRFKV